MPKPPKVSAAAVRARIRRNVEQAAREPFQAVLADALYNKPKNKHWRALANDPEAWARSVKNLAPLAGYVDRRESLNVTMSSTELADTLVARYGPDKARQMLALHGLPESLIPTASADTGTTIEGQQGQSDSKVSQQTASESP